MRLMLDILHPAHVHFFRGFVDEMQRRGHEVLIMARDKDVTLPLLDRYGLPYEVLSRQGKSPPALAVELATRTTRFVRRARQFQPDYLVGLMGPVIALAGRVLPARTIVLYDNESAHKVNRMAYALSDAYWTPSAFAGTFGRKHYRYRSYPQLAYLHPSRFAPDEEVLRRYGLSREQPYFVVRFVSWQSIHDIGESGFSLEGKRRLVDILKEHGRVLISAEGDLPPDLEPYRLRISVEDMHHILAFAQLFVGESSTMASESAVLGTHSVYVSKTGRGVNDEQQARYGLSDYFTTGQEERVLARVRELLADSALKEHTRERQERLLRENVDVTAFLVSYFESGCQDTSGAQPR